MGLLGRLTWFCAATLICGVAFADPPPVGIAEGVKSVLIKEEKTKDGVLTVHDNNLFVQCLGSHFLPAWRCEAAGFEGQPWLHHVLTPERQALLATIGFKPDPQFGNFILMVPKTTDVDTLAALILRVLTDVYAVKPEDIDVKAEWLPFRRCHRRIMAGHDLGGAILTPTFGFKKDGGKGCRLESDTDAQNYDDPAAIIPAARGIDVDARYLPAMTNELSRVERADKALKAYVIFITGPAYVQCLRGDGADDGMYCEAVSEDAVGKPIERILTPERKAKLTQAGFAPPGKVMNYSRFYPAGQYDMPRLAKVLLGILKDVYGYQGAPPMKVHTETGAEHPLVP